MSEVITLTSKRSATVEEAVNLTVPVPSYWQDNLTGEMVYIMEAGKAVCVFTTDEATMLHVTNPDYLSSAHRLIPATKERFDAAFAMTMYRLHSLERKITKKPSTRNDNNNLQTTHY